MEDMPSPVYVTDGNEEVRRLNTGPKVADLYSFTLGRGFIWMIIIDGYFWNMSPLSWPGPSDI